jgi:hypothetical protein
MAQTDQTRARDGSSESPWTPAQRTAIWAEADRILANPSFKKSRRCVVLFRRLIEHALEGGDEGGIKERTLGMEVFGREADYDTNTDPIVRMTANEIRKRLAQYYQSSTDHHGVHISLIPGSYLPRFSFGLRVVSPAGAPGILVGSEVPPDAAAEPVSPTEPEIPGRALEPPSAGRRVRFLAPGLLAALVVVGLMFAALDWTNALRSNQYMLWAPLLKAPEPVIICVADETVPQITSALASDWASEIADQIAGRKPPVASTADTSMPLTPFVDAEVSARVAGWFKEHGKPFRLARVTRLTLEDFRHGPAVLVGAFDNVWNLALYSKLRYHVQVDPATKDEWIEDSQNPGSREWKGSGKLLYSDSSVDYAIITRVFNKDTGTWFVTAGGLGMHATEAAGDLLTDPDLSRSLPEAIRSGNRNVQIVLKTTVIGAHTGAPQILAVHTW